MTAIRALEGAWGVWADSVRQEAEDRLGVAYPESPEVSEPVVMTDGEYGRALDVGASVYRLQAALQEVVNTLGAAEGQR